MIFETVRVGDMQVNCYILACAEGAKALIIDPGDDELKIRRYLDNHKLSPGIIVNTHGHYDHIGADDAFNVPVYVYELDAPMLRDARLNFSGFFSTPRKVTSQIIKLKDGQIISYEGIRLKVLHIPGHTPGGMALLMQEPENNIVFTGDSLFCQGIGRTDFEGGDQAALIKGIKDKLLTLPDKTLIYPGHGPSSTIGEEKKGGYFV
jgi:glyoxylase-like metal-dependent hydrolase (beta-lactamase superfamily II)